MKPVDATIALSTITGIATAAKATIEAVRASLAKSKGREEEKATRAALGLVDDLQARIFELQEIAFRLHREKAEALEENSRLCQELRRKEERAAERQKYKPHKLGKAVVLVHEEESEEHRHFYCTTCMETKGQSILLQPHPMRSRHGYYCSQCKTSYFSR